MPEDKRISEAEWKVLEVLWKESPLTSAEIIARLEAETEWAPNTVRTLLARLKDKGAISPSTREGKMRYKPRLTREKCVRSEGDNFLSRVFGGRMAPLLLHFAREAKLTPEEARELRDILEKGDRP
jgi:BlaI family penicillinase repressor